MKKYQQIINLLIVFFLAFSIVAGCTCNKKSKDQQKQNEAAMITINKQPFGTVDGKQVFLYTLTNKQGTIVKITNYGGIVTSIIVPGKNGEMADVVLGFDSLHSYLAGHPYFGCIVGRCANRIGNASFKLNGKEYQLAANIPPNHLHGGIKGFDKKVWEPEDYMYEGEPNLSLVYASPDGEEGYPGNMKVRVTYTLTEDNELKIAYYAMTDQATPVNLTHHSYFNLKGAGNGDILDQVLTIDADRYTVVNDQLMPTGELRDVTGTPFDFRQPKPVGQDMSKVSGGYDHNFALNNKGELALVATLQDPASGRMMEVYSTEPGMQFYGGNFLDGSVIGKGGKAYQKHYGLCLETQHFPDAVHQPAFPSVILEPGKELNSLTIYKFFSK